MWYAEGMRPPIFVRTLTDDERQALEKGLRSNDAFVLRRCQILLASARGERAPRIADVPGHRRPDGARRPARLQRVGTPSLQKKSSRAHRTRLVFSTGAGRALTRALAAQPPRLRQTRQPVDPGVGGRGQRGRGDCADAREREDHPPDHPAAGHQWKRAKHWITSPDPGMPEKKGSATA